MTALSVTHFGVVVLWTVAHCRASKQLIGHWNMCDKPTCDACKPILDNLPDLPKQVGHVVWEQNRMGSCFQWFLAARTVNVPHLCSDTWLGLGLQLGEAVKGNLEKTEIPDSIRWFKSELIDVQRMYLVHLWVKFLLWELWSLPFQRLFLYIGFLFFAQWILNFCIFWLCRRAWEKKLVENMT